MSSASYFHVSRNAQISAKSYRLVSPAITEQGIEFEGEVIALVSENAARIRQAVKALRAQLRTALGTQPILSQLPGPRLQCGFMRRRSRLRDILEFLVAWKAVKSLEWAPLPVAHWLSRRYVGLLDLSLPRLRRVADRNLSLAMPALDAAGRAAIADGIYRSIARLLVSFAKFPSIRRDNVARWIRCEGAQHFEEAIRRGRGVLFAAAHLGNWELSAFAHALLEKPMRVVVRPLDNPLIDALVERRRGLSGNRPVFKKDYARAILKALAANEAVGILIDQNAAADSGVFVDFFGVPACAGAGFVKIAAHSGATVLPGFALWSESERRYVLRFYPPVEITGDAARDTQTLHTRLEEVIRAYPDQWLWIHRRWKTRPPGEPPLY